MSVKTDLSGLVTVKTEFSGLAAVKTELFRLVIVETGLCGGSEDRPLWSGDCENRGLWWQ